MANLRRIRLYDPAQAFTGQTSFTLSQLAAMSQEEADAIDGRVPLMESYQQYLGQTSMTVDEFAAYVGDLQGEDNRRISLYPSYLDRSGQSSLALGELREAIGDGGEPEPDSSMFDFSDPRNTVNIILVGF